MITWQMQWGLWSMDLSLSGERQGQVGGSKTASIVADLSETTFETLYGEERCVWLGHRGVPAPPGSRPSLLGTPGGSLPPDFGICAVPGSAERFIPWCGTPPGRGWR